jgi:PAS domain-containing protein
MSLGRESPSGLGLAYVWRDAFARTASPCMTIRGRILIAFSLVSAITAVLSAHATLGITGAGILASIMLCGDISRLKKQEWSLRESNLLLDASLENMSQGICLYDAQNRLEIFNQRFLEIFGLSPERIKPGISYKEVLAISVGISNHVGVEQILAEQAEFLREKPPKPHLYDLNNGRVVACLYCPTSDGRWVATYEDVTERRRGRLRSSTWRGTTP